MAAITLNHIKKTFDDGITVIDDLSLKIKDGEFVIFVGPSGCGKSTTLRMIAGLEEITSGDLIIGDKRVNDTPSKNRDIAMVFQSYALYPHMSVYKNMAFALKLRKVPKSVIDKKVREAARILELEEYLNRKPKALSGGQRQRVALGRAMVRNPSVFLLDEPLSNLDAKLRTQMRSQISLLHQQLKTTFVYVTHDQTEAMTMADRIVVMNKGKIMQYDTPNELYTHPKNTFVAGFIGSPQMNFINAVIDASSNEIKVYSDDLELPLPDRMKRSKTLLSLNGKKIIYGIRSEDITEPTAADGSNIIRLKTELTEMTGSEKYIYSSLNASKITARVHSDYQTKINDYAEFSFNAEKAHIFDNETGLLICD